jgi:hypothetical protein
MNQPSTQAPSRVSIAALGVLAAVVIVAAFWIGAPPEEQYSTRHVVGFVLSLVLGLEVMIRAVDRAQRRMAVLGWARREAEAAEHRAQIREANTGRWTAAEDPEHVVMELWWDQGTWRATGPLLMNVPDSTRDECGWIILPSDGYARAAVTNAEADGFVPAGDLATRQMRTHLGLVWAEPDDVVDSD